MDDMLWIGLPTVGFALLGGTALWVSVNHNNPHRVSWWAAMGITGTLLTILLVSQLLIG